MNDLLRRRQRFSEAEPVERVVEVGDGEGRVLSQLMPAMRIQALPQFADARLLRTGAVREGESLKAERVVIRKVIADTVAAAGADRPEDVESAGKDAQEVGIGLSD